MARLRRALDRRNFKMKRIYLLLALALACMQMTLLLRTAWDKSDTIDEPTYMGSAVHQWTQATRGGANFAFDRNCEAPALPKWGIAAGLRLADPELFSLWIKRGKAKEPDPLRPPIERTRLNLFAARWATIALTVIGGLFLWSAARRFGETAAIVTHVLWTFSPTILAQGSLATLDGWLTAFCCFAIWVAFRLWDRPGLFWTTALGATLGLAAACKVTALGMAPVAAVLAGTALARAARGRGNNPVAAVGLGALCGIGGFFFALWAAYGFSYGEVLTGGLCGGKGVFPGLAPFGPVPFSSWISGLLLQWIHGEGGHLSYLFGEASSDGWWWFYLASLALKTTIGAQAAGLLGLTALDEKSAARERPGVRCASSRLPHRPPWRDERGADAERHQVHSPAVPLRHGVDGARRHACRPGFRRLGHAGPGRLPVARRHRIAGRPSPSPDVLQPVGGRARGRASLSDPRRRLGTGPAQPGRVHEDAEALASLLHLLQRQSGPLGIGLGTCALRADERLLRDPRHRAPSAQTHAVGVPQLAHHRTAGRTHRLLDLLLSGDQSPNRAPGEGAWKAEALLGRPAVGSLAG